ncbi:MAG: DUF4384 domain-containing protein [Methylococcaceae bacterium]|nr:MAG: DUF4384 domain-containing protein [Methylococcaceae bacterium]
MKTISKRYNPLYAAMFVAVLGASTSPTLALAEAGAKSMFSSEGTSVMMNDDADTPKATSSRPKARVASERVSPSYSSNEQPDANPNNYAGVQYYIDLQDASGRSRQVPTSYTFRSGDGIKLKIKSKTEGYLYVMNTNAAGQSTPLYPTNGQPSGLIQANTIYTIPPRGMIYFDNEPGTEKVTIALAKFPLPSVDPAYSAKGSTAAYSGQSKYDDCASSSGAGSKGMFASESSSSMDCIRSNHSAGSKGMFTQEDTSSAEPASYAVAPTAALNEGDVLFVDFNLIHR